MYKQEELRFSYETHKLCQNKYEQKLVDFSKNLGTLATGHKHTVLYPVKERLVQRSGLMTALLIINDRKT